MSADTSDLYAHGYGLVGAGVWLAPGGLRVVGQDQALAEIAALNEDDEDDDAA